MKWNTIGHYARQIVNELSELSSKRIGGTEQAQGTPAGASQTQELSGKPATDQRAALNTWEGEGGSL